MIFDGSRVARASLTSRQTVTARTADAAGPTVSDAGMAPLSRHDLDRSALSVRLPDNGRPGFHKAATSPKIIAYVARNS